MLHKISILIGLCFKRLGELLVKAWKSGFVTVFLLGALILVSVFATYLHSPSLLLIAIGLMPLTFNLRRGFSLWVRMLIAFFFITLGAIFLLPWRLA